MGLSELQKGFGPGLLRQASPEGKLIAELQALVGAGLLSVDVRVTTAQLKALTTPLQILAPPRAAEFYDVSQVDALFLPGADADSDPLLQANNYPVAVSLGDPANGRYLAIFDTELLLGAGFIGATAAYLNIQAATGYDGPFSQAAGQGVWLSFEHFGAPQTDQGVSGNGDGDAVLHLRLHYRLRNLDF